MLLAPNDLLMVGTAITLIEAEAVPPLWHSFAVMAPVLLFFVPALVPVTFTEKVQEAPGVSVAPDRLIVLVFLVAVMVPPSHVPVRPFGFETARPDGKLSLNEMPVSDIVVFGLVIVKLSEVEPPTRMLAAPKTFEIVGGATTVMLAVPGLLDPDWLELAVTLLIHTPPAMPFTVTDSLQDLPTASVTPDRLMVEEPAVAVAVPPHLLVSPLGEATTRPAGRLSVNVTPVSEEVFAAGLVSVKVRVVVPFTGMLASLNFLLIEGGVPTVSVAVAWLPVVPVGAGVVEVTLPVVLV